MIIRTALLVLVLVSCPVSHAASGSLRGTVTAGPGATPISEARVVLRAGGREQSTFTAVDGRYEFPSLDPTLVYSIAVEASGLRPFRRSAIILRDGETVLIDASLQLADVHTTVLVTGGVISLESDNAAVSQTIGATEVQEIPSVTRSTAKYALLDPHVRQAIGLGSDYQDANRLSINAASYRHTSFMLDGTTNYDWVYAVSPQATVSPASVEDVKVLTGDYSAQYGNSTAGIIVVTTPSGTNTHHGNLFAYIRPSGIQARPELAAYHIPNQKLDWGASVGGPIAKDRTYYFSSYERVQQDRGSVITSPAASFFDGRTSEHSGLLRVDHNLSQRNTLTGRMNLWHYDTNDANDRVAGISQPSYGRIARVQSWGGQVSDQATIGNAVNVARFAYTNYVPDSATPLNSSVGAVVPNYLQSGYSTYSWVHAQTETASDLVAARRGRHNLKFGGESVHLRVKDYSYSPYGTYSFYTAADFAARNPYQYTQTYGANDVRYGQNELSAFVQDDVRLTPRFTASLGVRYEFQSITDSHHNLGPRLGLAWDATGDGKTMVRAAGGIFFDQYYMYLNRRFMTLGPNTPQHVYTWDCTKVVCPTYPNSVSDPAGVTASRPASYLYIPADQLLTPYSYQASVSLEREIAPGMVLALSGLHTHTLQQMRVNDINHPAPFTRTAPAESRTTAEADKTRPYYQKAYDGVSPVGMIDRIENTASSIYQSFDVSLKKRFSRWGEINAHYVLSASYAYAMFYADYNSGVPNEWWPNWDRDERGPSDFYQRNRFITDAVLKLPGSGTLSLVGNFGSGLPVNPITGKDNNGDGYIVDRPVGYGRNSFHTPPQKTVDVAVGKQFTLHDRLRAEARVEALNAFNSKNFLSVHNTYGNGAKPLASFLTPIAGVTNTDPSRQLQFAFKLLF